MNGEWWSALPPLPLPHEMQQWDKQAVELGILPEILMENAAAAAFSIRISGRMPSSTACLSHCCISCGRGSGGSADHHSPFIVRPPVRQPRLPWFVHA